MQKSSHNLFFLAGGLLALIVLVLFFMRPAAPKVDQTDPAFQQLDEEIKDDVVSLVENIRSGGPGKDGIPAIDEPVFESIEDANGWLEDQDVVFGVIDGDQAYAFPQRIVVWHEIVNIEFEGSSASLTYCPLTGTAIGFTSVDSEAADQTLGVSGKLVNSNLIMYDRDSDSYWPQVYAAAITGERIGQRLDEFPVTWTTWSQWKEAYSDSLVLSRDTGYIRDYTPSGDPYGSYLDEGGYYFTDNLLFSPIHESDALAPKEVVIGVRDVNNNAVAVVKTVLQSEGETSLELGDRRVRIVFKETTGGYEAFYEDTGEWVNAFDAMWFAWFAYYPETTLMQ